MTHRVGFGSLLDGQHGASLTDEVGTEGLGNLWYQPPEQQLIDELFDGLLVLPDLPQGH